VSEAASSTSTVTLSYPKAGSSNELLDEQGAALANKCMAFMSGSGMSTRFIYRAIEDAGGVPIVNADRTKSTLGYTVSPDNATKLVGLLAVNCDMEKWDIRDALEQAATEAEVANSSAQIVLTENLYAAAYGPQSPAGRPFFSTGVSVDALKAFRERTYGLNGAVLSATGIPDHSAFCAEVGEVLSASHVGSADAAAPLSYIGGESRVAVPGSGYAHVALAFQSPGSSVLANIVKCVFDVVGQPSGASGFTGDGFVGIYGGSASPGGIVDSMTSAIKTATSGDAIKRAKGLAKAEALFALDGGSTSLANVMTASVLETGTFSGPADVAKAYDAVTESQVKSALTSVLKSNPSLAAVGDITSVPYHATVASLLK